MRAYGTVIYVNRVLPVDLVPIANTKR